MSSWPAHSRTRRPASREAERWRVATVIASPPIARTRLRIAHALASLPRWDGGSARKGIFPTTSTFTRDAQDFATKIDSHVVLIDGPTLAILMIDHNVGVVPVRSFDLKRIDSDFFSEE